jgi:hypothetical protein
MTARTSSAQGRGDRAATRAAPAPDGGTRCPPTPPLSSPKPAHAPDRRDCRRRRPQPRRRFDPADEAHLVTRSRRAASPHPIVVKPHLEHPDAYELIDGERRLRAARRLQRTPGGSRRLGLTAEARTDVPLGRTLRPLTVTHQDRRSTPPSRLVARGGRPSAGDGSEPPIRRDLVQRADGERRQRESHKRGALPNSRPVLRRRSTTAVSCSSRSGVQSAARRAPALRPERRGSRTAPQPLVVASQYEPCPHARIRSLRQATQGRTGRSPRIAVPQPERSFSRRDTAARYPGSSACSLRWGSQQWRRSYTRSSWRELGRT